MSTIDDAILKAVESFVVQLKGLIQNAALESVQTALNGNHSSRRASKPQRTAVVPGSLRSETGSKRTAAELNALIKRLHAHVTKHPGLRIEAIGTALGVPTKALVLPVKRLVSERKLTTKGQKRATVYFAH
ncbi:MAG TPA: hypothetical protein VJV79_06040 [Polyangiaceae bacterium]|nr:hypothetical protein [Polyangiaceae bacterium]